MVPDGLIWPQMASDGLRWSQKVSDGIRWSQMFSVPISGWDGIRVVVGIDHLTVLINCLKEGEGIKIMQTTERLRVREIGQMMDRKDVLQMQMMDRLIAGQEVTIRQINHQNLLNRWTKSRGSKQKILQVMDWFKENNCANDESVQRNKNLANDGSLEGRAGIPE